ncbi:MAG: TonB-dependent receptor, partial [Sinobacterium sp.]
ANVYFSVAEGFRSGGFNLANSPTYDPETVIAYELGAKANFLGGKVTTDGAFYHSDYIDYQSFMLDGPFAVVSNPGEAQIQGLELAARISISEQVSVGLSGNYTDTEFTKVSLSVPINLNGDPITNIPLYSYSLNTRYEFNWSSSIAGFGYLEYNRQSGSYSINRLGLVPVVKSSPLGQLNARIGAQWSNFNINLFAQNLTNDVRGTTAAVAGTLDSQNRPRTLGLEFNYEF